MMNWCALRFLLEELPRALDPAMTRKFVEIFKALGFKFVTLDLEGFRSGSMNSLWLIFRSRCSHMLSECDTCEVTPYLFAPLRSELRATLSQGERVRIQMVA